MKEPRAWGYWTEVKLDALSAYLQKFNTASQRAPTTIYLDLFAGGVINRRRDDPDRYFLGSTVRAIETVPRFSRLFFFELDNAALDLNRELRRRYADDRRWSVTPGDCNHTVGRVLDDLRRQGLDWSPTFAFVDPDGLDVSWSTLERIAHFKHSKARTKAEMWILFSHSAIPRLDGHDSALGTSLSDRATIFFGTDMWRAIADRRRNDEFSAEHARRLYIALFRRRLEERLGYATTLTLDLGNENGTPIYTMVFATDHSAGTRIMTSVLKRARDQTVEYRDQTREDRARAKRDEAGTPSLFDVANEAVPASRAPTSLKISDDSLELPPWLTP